MMSQKREAEVWDRVMAASAEAPCCTKPKVQWGITSQQVMELLEHELEDACTYRTLAMRVKKPMRQTLLCLYREELNHYRKLEAVYYIMTGKRPCPDRPKAPCVACTNEELRKRYEEEVKNAEAYHCLAKSAGSFAPVFHCLGNNEEHHAHTVLNLLQKCL